MVKITNLNKDSVNMKLNFEFSERSVKCLSSCVFQSFYSILTRYHLENSRVFLEGLSSLNSLNSGCNKSIQQQKDLVG